MFSFLAMLKNTCLGMWSEAISSLFSICFVSIPQTWLMEQAPEKKHLESPVSF